MIWTRAQWQKKRDAAGGKSGMVKGVNLGALLEAYEKASKGRKGLEAMFYRSKTLTPLLNGLKKYRAGLPRDQSKVAVIVDDMIESVQAEIKLGGELANPVVNLSKYIKACIANSKKVMASGDANAYGKLYKEDVRGFGTSLGKLVQIDKGIKDIYEVWKPYTTGDWNTEGKYVLNGATDPVQRAKRIKAAAKEINGLAIKVHSEMKARKLTL